MIGELKKGVVGICQLKGGVGASTMSAALASCWARNGLRAAIVDLDDLNPHLTEWAGVAPAYRSALAEHVRNGTLSAAVLPEIAFPVESYFAKLVTVGQPDAYHESFQYKANVIAGAQSASEFIPTLIRTLSAEYDAVVLDMSRSWGMATFSALPLCEHVVFVTDDDPVSVSRSMRALARLKRESEDPGEFDFGRWSLLLNGYTNRLVSPKELVAQVRETKLFPQESNLFVVPFSERGRDWGKPGQSFYDTAGPRTRSIIEDMAAALIAFERPANAPSASNFFQRLSSVLGVRPEA